MQHDKENLPSTPVVKEVMKRPSLQSPWSAASPNVRGAPKKIGRPLQELGDQNLDATNAYDETLDMSSVKRGLNESVLDTPSSPTSPASGVCYGDRISGRSTGSALKYSETREEEFRQNHLQDFRLDGDANLEESAFGETFTCMERKERYESCDSLKAVSLTENHPTSVFCDPSLEETAVESTFCECETTHGRITYCSTEDPNGTSKSNQSLNSTLTGNEINVQNGVNVVCDANLEETSWEPTFCESEFSQIVMKNNINPSDKISFTEQHNNTHVRIICDSNLAETSIEPNFYRCDVTQDTMADNIAKELTSTTFTIAVDKDDIPIRVSTDANLEESAIDPTFCGITQSVVVAGDETLTNDCNEVVTPAHHTHDANPEGICSNAAKAHASELKLLEENSHSIRVFVDAKASPVRSSCEELGEDFDYKANELGELRANLNRSQEIKVTASVNVSVVEETEDSRKDITSISERSREFSPVSTALSNITQFGNEPVSQYAANETEDHSPSLSSFPTSTAADSFTNVAEDTYFVLQRLERQPSMSRADTLDEQMKGDPVPMEKMQSDGTESEEKCLPPIRCSNPRLFAQLSPIADLSRSNVGSRASTIRCSMDLVSDCSPPISQNRKYNMNDSEISFLMNENKIYDMALRNAVESPEEVTSLRDRVAQLEKDKGELNEKLRTITGELDGFKAAVNSKSSELMEAAKKLNEVTKAKEHAERTVADYEFIVEDLKRRNNEQKEDLHSKIISLEGEMESYRAQIRSQVEMTFTASGLSTELTLVREQLMMTKDAHNSAEERCKELAKELELSANENLNLLNQVAEISAKSEVLQNEVKELERMVKERETALKNEEESRSKQYHELETRCKEAESSMNKSIGEVESLKKQLEAALNDLTVLREIQTGSEMELIELKDQLKNATEESETSRAKEADLREKFEDVQCALKEKSQLLEQAHKNSVEMSSKIAELKEELDAEKLARDVTGRELEQLREENNLIAAVAKEAKSALSDAQSQVEEANKRCEEQAQRHEEEVALRVSELQSVLDAHSSEKAAFARELGEYQKKLDEMTKKLEQMAETITALEKEAAELREQKKNLSSELELGIQVYEEKVAELDQIAKLITDKEEEIAQLSEAKKDLLEEIQLVKHSLEEKVDEIEKLKAASAAFTESAALLESERDSLKSDLAATQEKLCESEKELKRLESMGSEIAVITSERDGLQDRLNAAEELITKFREEEAQIRAALEQSQAQIAALTAQKTLLEEDFQAKESEYKEKLAASDMTITELNAVVEKLGLERNQLSERLSATQQELTAKETAAKSLVTLERVNISLKSEMNALETELEAAKQQHQAEIGVAQETIDDLRKQLRESMEKMEKAESSQSKKVVESSNEEVAELKRALLLKEAYAENLAKKCDKLAETETELTQQISDLCEERNQLKAQMNEGVRMLAPDHTIDHNESPSKDAQQKIEALEREVDILKMEKQQLEKIANYSSCNEVGELKRYLAIKDDYIEYLGKQCDEFDDIEAKYREEIADLCKERDRLKAQIDPSSVPVVPVLTEALTNGIKMLTPDHPKTRKEVLSEESEQKIHELQALVKKLEEEKKQLIKQKSQDDKVIQQSAEQRELCEQQKMKDAEQKIEALEREVDILKVEKQQLEKIANYSSCNEVGELKRYLAIKDDYIEYLGKQCDEFDDIEAKYKEEIADLCKERDRLKAQIDPSSVPVVPVLTEGLTNGIKMLTPDHPRTHKQDSSEEAERKVLELEALVEKLEEEKKQFSRISNQVNETAELKSRVAELMKENAALRSQCTSEASKPCLLDAHGKRLCEEEEMNERSDKDDAFTSAPSSPTLQSRSYDSFAGPAHEESTIETAAVTPNRTLHTTLYKRIDKTTNLLETSDATKRENSRCAQQ
ncbi:hypothetical protein RB195_000904 [Necator americanus]|uniref:M protein repeat protein n=1 Tax=Necator americanus TaxID=51031 RepID=A0ABR1DD66_NECAM